MSRSLRQGPRHPFVLCGELSLHFASGVALVRLLVASSLPISWFSTWRWIMRSRLRRPCLEALEDRWCPAVTTLLSGGTLGLTGDSVDLHISRSASGAFTVLDNGNPVSSQPFAA